MTTIESASLIVDSVFDRGQDVAPGTVGWSFTSIGGFQRRDVHAMQNDRDPIRIERVAVDRKWIRSRLNRDNRQ